MALFRKKPVIINALRFTGDNVDRVLSWMIDLNHTGHAHGHGPLDGWGDEGALIIQTLEGDMRADPGDWIIRGVQGEFYPCKDDIFRKTYDPVN